MSSSGRAARAVVAAGVAGQLSAAAVGALPWPLLALTSATYVTGAWWSSRATGAQATVLRHAGSVIALIAMAAALVSLPHPVDPSQVKGSLGLTLVGAQVGQALGWRQDRDLRTGLVTAVGMLVLGASYAPDVLVGLPLLVGWVAVLVALAHLHGARPVLPATAVAVVLGLVAFLLVPAPVSAGLRNRLAGVTGLPTRSDLGAPVFSGDQLDLRRRGALGTAPVAVVPADSPQLWRAATFDSYDGTNWSRPTSGVLEGGPAYQVANPVGPTRQDRVLLREAANGSIWSPGRLVAVTAPGIRVPLVNELGDVELPGVRGSYEVTSEEPVTDLGRLRATGGDTSEARWRSLPVDLPPRVTELARQVTAGTASHFDAAEAIAAWLRSHATYRLDSPVPQPGQDAVDRFLFVDKTGFCEQFASAEVVLLRSLGIPARLVTGLAGGEPADGGRLLRVKDSHAWVEVWVPGVGWVSSDPTAGVPLAAGTGSSTGVRARVSAAVTDALRSLTRLPGGRTSLALGLLALTAGAALVLLRRPPSRRTSDGPAVTAGGPALQAFLRLDARLGDRRRRPGESLRELSTRLDPGLVDALGVVERECYAPVRPDPVQAVEALDSF